jgi:hypothetical protein
MSDNAEATTPTTDTVCETPASTTAADAKEVEPAGSEGASSTSSSTTGSTDPVANVGGGDGKSAETGPGRSEHERDADADEAENLKGAKQIELVQTVTGEEDEEEVFSMYVRVHVCVRVSSMCIMRASIFLVGRCVAR